MTSPGNLYAAALYRLAREENADTVILRQLLFLDQCFQLEPAYLQLLSTPLLPQAQRCEILDAAFRGKVHPYVLNFLKILTEKGKIRLFDRCCSHFQQQYNRDHAIVQVIAVTAVPLSANQATKLTGKLSSLTGKTVSLQNRVDSRVLGGIRLHYEGKQLDDTLSHRLQQLRSLLQDTLL